MLNSLLTVLLQSPMALVVSLALGVGCFYAARRSTALWLALSGLTLAWALVLLHHILHGHHL